MQAHEGIGINSVPASRAGSNYQVICFERSAHHCSYVAAPKTAIISSNEWVADLLQITRNGGLVCVRTSALLGMRANCTDYKPCKMFPLTGAERKVRLRSANENASLRFHGRRDTVRAIVQ